MKYELMMSLLLLSFVFAACTSNAIVDTEMNNDDSDINNEQLDEEIKVKDTKTVAEITDEKIMQLIANGVYEDDATYEYHSGTETITIRINAQDDIITELSIIGNNPSKVSEKYINGVNDALQTLSVGKSISEVASLPDQISGSSLTVAAFKEHTAKLIEDY